ncbi:MAG TPA: D-aminoacyl-tRNA deacylase [Candidatus Saccharimonadales bacterium]|jgi:D-tyrosyl-tRNA(Tyr) deacylase|nr:D-aminoacyl-tRNA deacylase [Candidatus Saccharimonadales bacterium]
MRLVVQRVEKAKVVKVDDGSVVGEIGKGFFVLVGIKKGDVEKTVEQLADKLSRLRVMSDKNEKMNLSVTDAGGSMLVVSQFTLHADTSGGNRPSFINAEEPNRAKELYEFFVTKLREKGLTIETGSFGDYMKIETILDGPVTIIYSD